MTGERMKLLTNDGWGFESNCFVCEPRNESGLRIPFHHDTVDDVIVAEFELDERFSGAPRFVHGGVVLAVIDEAMAWATIAVAGKFAVTTETTTRFDRPTKVGGHHTVRAWIVSIDGLNIETAAEVTRSDGKPCARATASFTALDLGQASNAVGAPVTGDAADFTTSTPDA